MKITKPIRRFLIIQCNTVYGKQTPATMLADVLAGRYDPLKSSAGDWTSTLATCSLFSRAAGFEVDIIKADSQDLLLRQLGKRCDEGKTGGAVVIVGHSNEHGLQLFSDELISWPSVATWLDGLKPESVTLLACQGGRLIPSRALFATPSLLEVWGVPSKCSLMDAFLVWFPHLVSGCTLGDAEPDFVKWLQAINVLCRDGIIPVRHTRKQYEEGKPEEIVGMTLLEEIYRHAIGR